MKRIVIGLSLAALAAAGAAVAQGAAGKGPHGGGHNKAPITRAEAQTKAETMFVRMDANSDGKLDTADHGARKAAMFDRMDANRDGQLSRTEFVDFKPAPGAAGEGHEGPDAGEHRMGERGGMGEHGGMRGHHRRGHGMHGMMMRMADANKDGAVSRQEFVAGALTRFDQADANRDGTLTPEERRAAHGAMRQHRGTGANAPAAAN